MYFDVIDLTLACYSKRPYLASGVHQPTLVSDLALPVCLSEQCTLGPMHSNNRCRIQQEFAFARARCSDPPTFACLTMLGYTHSCMFENVMHFSVSPIDEPF